jgi:CDP-diacylglycerol--serine O-phosphatidyltransferase
MSDAPHAPVDGSTRARARRLRGRLRRRTDRAIPGVKVLPTMMTLANLVCGFAAIFYAARAGEAGGPTPFGWHPLTVAGVLVFLGMAFDAVDGSLARLTRSTSDLGAQLDSLADVVTFGVAPAFMMLRLVSLYYGPGEHGPAETILGPDAGNLYARLCWSVAAIYICCTALRLARFNASLDVGLEKPKPAYAYNFFTGVPAPAGAGCALFPLFGALAFGEWGWPGFAVALRHPILVGAVLVVVGGMMVSTLPTWSFKNFKVPRAVVLPVLLGVGAFVALLVAEPWAALAAAGIIYLGMLPFSVRSYLALKAEAEARIEQAAEPATPPPG